MFQNLIETLEQIQEAKKAIEKNKEDIDEEIIQYIDISKDK